MRGDGSSARPALRSGRDQTLANERLRFAALHFVGQRPWRRCTLSSRAGPERQRDLWILDLAGSFLTQVTHQPAEFSVFRWGKGWARTVPLMARSTSSQYPGKRRGAARARHEYVVSNLAEWWSGSSTRLRGSYPEPSDGDSWVWSGREDQPRHHVIVPADIRNVRPTYVRRVSETG